MRPERWLRNTAEAANQRRLVSDGRRLPATRSIAKVRHNSVQMFRRNRFGDLIGRQLDIFGQENADLLLEIAEYRERWRRASRHGAEEAYGEEQDRVDGRPRRSRGCATATR